MAGRDGATPRRDAGMSRRAARGVLALLVVLGAGLIAPTHSRGQQPPDAAAKKDAAPEPSRGDILPLGVKYRFIESYGTEPNPDKPALITEYQVGVSEDRRDERERPQGAPERKDGSLRIIYTERIARVTKGETTDVMRRYDAARISGALLPEPVNPPLLRGLTIWYGLRRGGFPEILTLNEGRRLREAEHEIVFYEIFFPTLRLILPATPLRVGDTWAITRQAGRALLGNSLPDYGDFQVEGKLLEVRRAATGNAQIAEFEISGELELEQSLGALKARIEFSFELPQPAQAAPAKAKGQGIVDANGWITKIRMGRKLWFPIDDNGRLNRIISRDLTLERRLVKPPTVGLTLPQPPPAANPSNSWVLYDDEKGRFHFLHPQDLMPKPGDPYVSKYGVQLVSVDMSHGKDVIHIIPPPPVEDPGGNPEFRDPGAMIRWFESRWKDNNITFVTGHSGWFPDREWGPSRKVFHHEIAGDIPEPEGNKKRVYWDRYLVQFQRKPNLIVDVLTSRDDHAAFRKEARDLIKTLTLGPSQGSGGAPPAGPAATPGQGQVPPAGAGTGTPSAPSSPVNPNPAPAGRPAAPTPPSPPR